MQTSADSITIKAPLNKTTQRPFFRASHLEEEEEEEEESTVNFCVLPG